MDNIHSKTYLNNCSKEALIDIILSTERDSIFKLSTDKSTQGIYFMYENREIFYANHKYFKLLGAVPFSEKPTLHVWQLIIDSKTYKRQEQIWKTILASSVFSFKETYQISTQNNYQQKWITENIQKVTDTDGKTFYIGTIQDVTKEVVEEELRSNKELVQDLAIKTSKFGVWDWDLDTGVLSCNEQYYKLLGFKQTPENFIPQDIINRLYPEDRMSALREQNFFIKGVSDRYLIEFRLRLESGNYHWFRSMGSAVRRNEDGKVTRIIGVLLNINEQKKTEEAIIQSEEKFRQMIENNPSGVCIYTKETFLYANPVFCQILGYKIHELIEFTPNQIFYNQADIKSQEVYNQFFDNEVANIRFDLKLLNKLNQEVWIDFHSSMTDLKDEQLAIASIYDITEKKSVEKRLGDTILDLKTVDEELRQNSEELMSINEALEKTMAELGKSLDKEKDVSERLGRKNKLLNEQKTQITNTLQSLRRTQTQLIQAEKMASLGILVSGLAHEINNTISYISISSEALKAAKQDLLSIIKAYEKITPDNVVDELMVVQNVKKKLSYQELIKEVDELTYNIASGAEQTAEIIRGLQHFSRKEGENEENVDIIDNLDSTLIVLHNKYKNICVIEKRYHKLPLIKGSYSKLNQVFMNIINNAIDAIEVKLKNLRKKGLIIIKTEELTLQKMILVTVSDNGNGIPETVKPKVFEPFFTTKEVGKGTGLGLAISMGIIQSHGGKLEFESKEGVGTVFKIYLPF